MVVLVVDGRVRVSLAALYGEIESCRKAVDDFRQKENIQSPLTPIDVSSVFWKKL
jgi:Macrocin-O-methyltransferase (TylF)